MPADEIAPSPAVPAAAPAPVVFAAPIVVGAVAASSRLADAGDCVALIYSPGMFEWREGRGPGLFAERLTRGLDHEHRSVRALFKVRPAAAQRYAGETLEVQVYEVVRTLPGGAPEVSHRVFFLDYQPELETAHEGGNLFTQGLAAGSVLWVLGWRYAKHGLRAHSLGPNQKVTLVVGGAGLVLLAVYLGLLVMKVVDTLPVDMKVSGLWPAWPGELVDWYSRKVWSVTGWHFMDRPVKIFIDWWEVLSAWFARFPAWWDKLNGLVVAIGLGALTLKRVREGLARNLSFFLLGARYFVAGLGRAACTGRFNDLLEHVAERHAGRIDVIGYSMGSLVVLDALFPFEGAPAARVDRVGKLTTIGCPFDLVRTFWPKYFEGRVVPATILAAPPEMEPETKPGSEFDWYNIFSPVDILGSNFKNETYRPGKPAKGKSTKGINDSDPIAAPVPADALSEAGDPKIPKEPAETQGENGAKASRARPLMPEKNLPYDHLGREELTWLDAVTLEGLAAHSQYWVRDKPRADSCLGLVVKQMYPAGDGIGE